MIDQFAQEEIEDFLSLIKNQDYSGQLFQRLDKDKSGVLEKKEIKCLLESIIDVSKCKTTKKRKDKIISTLNTVLEKYDTNKDGKISFDEFLKFMVFVMAQSIKDAIPKMGITVKEAIEAFEKVKINLPQEDQNLVTELIGCLNMK